jgi:hypothetical protein
MPDIEMVQTWSDLGAGLVTEPELIDWLRQDRDLTRAVATTAWVDAIADRRAGDSGRNSRFTMVRQ